MKILVLGAGGMVGHVMTIRLMELGHEVVGIARRNLDFCQCCTLDVTDEISLKSIICTGNYDAVVNSIGVLPSNIIRNIANGIWINSYLPHMLKMITENTKIRIIHLSTDCVFNGHGFGNYKETDFPDATDYYGRSKSLGELVDNKNLTLRTSVIGPDINENGSGLFHWFMKQSQSINGFKKAIWTGVSTIVLAEAVDKALTQKIAGVYQLVNNETISKYDLLLLFNRLRKKPIKIIKDESFSINKSLICTRSDFEFYVPPYSTMVSGMGRWIHDHKQYYPYYDIEVTI